MKIYVSASVKRSGDGSQAAPYQTIQEAAQVAVEQARREAELQLRRQVASLSLQIAEKVMRKELSSDKAQAEIVEKLLDELEHRD